MVKFLVRVLYFFIPVIIVLLPPVLVLWGSGENFRAIDQILTDNKKYLIGYVYNLEGNNNYVKWSELANSPKAEVVALGSSRALQFRQEMFQKSFYNAGYTIASIGDFLPFLENTPEEKYPDYLIINLDHWMFNANWDDFSGKQSKGNWQNSFSVFPAGYVFYEVYRDLFNGKYTIGQMFKDHEHKRIGLNAQVNGKGFRSDGSMDYGSQIQELLTDDPDFSDYQFKDTFSRIKKGEKRFEYGSASNPEAFWRLEQLLDFCKAKNIYVVGFLPPFADTVYSHMQATGKYKYLHNLPQTIAPVFSKNKFEFYDYSTMAMCGSDDSEALDGFHGGEATYLKMLIDMLEKNSRLNQVTDKSKLENDLKNSQNRYVVYDY